MAVRTAWQVMHAMKSYMLDSDSCALATVVSPLLCVHSGMSSQKRHGYDRAVTKTRKPFPSFTPEDLPAVREASLRALRLANAAIADHPISDVSCSYVPHQLQSHRRLASCGMQPAHGCQASVVMKGAQ